MSTLVLTSAEKLLLQRRRLGLNQAKMAKRLGVTPYVYKGWEREERDDAPKVELGKLADHERFLIYRLREGKTQDDVAREMGFKSRYWLRQMEQGKVNLTALRNYWNARP